MAKDGRYAGPTVLPAPAGTSHIPMGRKSVTRQELLITHAAVPVSACQCLVAPALLLAESLVAAAAGSASTVQAPAPASRAVVLASALAAAVVPERAMPTRRFHLRA